MALVVDVATDGVRIPVSRARVEHAATMVLRAERVRNAALSITFVSVREIARLNKKYLEHGGPTDVISFGLASAPGAPLSGDIYICADVARDNAREHHAPVREEILRLVVHGTLHVIGHDHPEGSARFESTMWKRQEKLVQRVMDA